MIDPNRDRNFIYKEKYEKKNPGKYGKLNLDGTAEDPSARHFGEGYLGGLTDHFNKGLNSLLHLQEEEARREGGEGGYERQQLPRIQLTRRFVAILAQFRLNPRANTFKLLPMVFRSPDRAFDRKCLLTCHQHG